jgi:hypothetical protein
MRLAVEAQAARHSPETMQHPPRLTIITSQPFVLLLPPPFWHRRHQSQHHPHIEAALPEPPSHWSDDSVPRQKRDIYVSEQVHSRCAGQASVMRRRSLLAPITAKEGNRASPQGVFRHGKSSRTYLWKPDHRRFRHLGLQDAATFGQ